MKGLVLLGSTGSIGRQTLDIVRAFPDEFKIVGLSAHNNRDLLLEQAREFKPRLVYGQSVKQADLPPGAKPITNLSEMVTQPDVELVMLAVVGAVGLDPAIAAVRSRKQIALANKEPVVMAGEILMAEARKYGAPILPVDSEPSAIWQCLRGEDADRSIRRLLITASGGAFRRLPLDQLAAMTPEAALKHPTWVMGKKITIDSATLMNKGFEVIESKWLFNLPWERVEAIIHPQSIIHSMVEFEDGSVKGQMGPPDMRFPIQHALFYPRRVANPNLQRFDPFKVATLTFEPMDHARYPCFSMAVQAGRSGGTYPAVLNAANEEAVDLFLNKAIGFLDIQKYVEMALNKHTPTTHLTLQAAIEADAWARTTVREAAKVKA
jgi:1-deoxy-D-xylulose-5-phosphate reductoisomerase